MRNPTVKETKPEPAPEYDAPKLEIKKDKRSLKCKFTDAEKLNIGSDLAEKTEQITQVEAEKKSVVKDFDAKIAELEAQVSQKVGWLRNGYEYRMVDITETIGEPNENAKTVRRMDTHEVVEIRDLTPEEKQRKLDFEKEMEAEAEQLPLE